MSKFNTYFANDFAACKLLATTHDPHRNRNVRLFLVPGEENCVGVTDGVDKWIAPVAGDPFGINIRQVIHDVRSGKPPYQASPPGGRRRLLIDQPPQEPQPTGRRKLLVVDSEPQTLPIRRRNVVQP